VYHVIVKTSTFAIASPDEFLVTGPPTHNVGGQTNNCRGCLSSSLICNAAGGRVGRPPGAWAIGQPTLHGGPVGLRPVKATPCYNMLWYDLDRHIQTRHRIGKLLLLTRTT